MLKETAIRIGILTGVAVIGYFILFYVIDKSLMLSSGVYWASTILFIGGMVYACRLERQKRGQAGLAIQDSIKIAFTTYVITAFLYHTWLYILMAYLDPSLVEIQKDMLLQQIERSSTVLGKELTEQVKDGFRSEGIDVSLSKSFFALAQSILFGFILAIPIAFTHRTLPSNQTSDD